MPRQARIVSNSRIYHIIIRGNERKDIFFDDEDRKRFIDIMKTKIEESCSKLFAYCLMDNHVHLIIYEGSEGIAQIMKRINVSYVSYFNTKYKRVGHLFQDRFRSEAIEDDHYLLEAVRYVHNNPVKASIVKKASDYKWSSYNLYKADEGGILEKDTVLGIFSEDPQKAIVFLEEFNEKDSDVKLIEYESRSRDQIRLEEEKEARKIIGEFLTRKNIPYDYCLSQKKIRNELIDELTVKGGLSIRRTAKILGLSRGLVEKVLSRK